MKRELKYPLLFFILMLSGYTRLDAQPCLPDGITFMYQEQIDNFQLIHPNCTEIGGNVRIVNENITSLSGLSVITSIGGDLYIQGTQLENLIGLNNLSNIDGSLHVGGSNSNKGNPLLVKLSGLDNLSSIGKSVYIRNNDEITDLTALIKLHELSVDLAIIDNKALSSLKGLDSIEFIGEGMWIGRNHSLINFDGLGSLTSVGMNIEIFSNNSLLNLSGMANLGYIGGEFVITHNYLLSNLSSLTSLSYIGGSLHIQHNYELADISGLINVTYLGCILGIVENSSLQSLKGLDRMNLENSCQKFIFDNEILSHCAVQSICDYMNNQNANLIIYSNASACNSVAEVAEACIVGIAEQQSATQLSIYPNPFTYIHHHRVYELNGNHPKFKLQYYNANGRAGVSICRITLNKGTHTIYMVSPSSARRACIMLC